MKRIFSDLHHGGLAYSNHLLGKRLDFDFYYPIGIEWFHNDYWAIAEPYNNNLDTVRQYLQLKPEHIPKDGTVSLNNVIGEHPTHYEVEDKAHGYIRKHITWDQFIAMDIDVIVASIPSHWNLYSMLRDVYKPKAKVVCHAGNHFIELDGAIQAGVVKNLLASLSPFDTHVHSLFYHQEIPLDVFYRGDVHDKKTIYSFVNCFSTADIFKKDWELFLQLEKLMPDWEFKAYGASCRDGNIQTIQEIAQKMREAQLVWHTKAGGDGFGHIVWDSAFAGRAVITRYEDYKGKLAGEFMKDERTSLFIDNLTPDQIKGKIERAYENRMALHMNIYTNVRNICDYDTEEKALRDFFDNLI